jgi:hypothetical protein
MVSAVLRGWPELVSSAGELFRRGDLCSASIEAVAQKKARRQIRQAFPQECRMFFS